MTSSRKSHSLFDWPIAKAALIDSAKKLDPRHQLRNPVMFVVELGSVLTTGLWIQALAGHGEAPTGFILAVSLWLWFTVIFANFAEAMAEGRGKAQADTLRKTRRDVMARKLSDGRRTSRQQMVPASTLRKGDIVLIEANEFIPG